MIFKKLKVVIIHIFCIAGNIMIAVNQYIIIQTNRGGGMRIPFSFIFTPIAILMLITLYFLDRRTNENLSRIVAVCIQSIMFLYLATEIFYYFKIEFGIMGKDEYDTDQFLPTVEEQLTVICESVLILGYSVNKIYRKRVVNL